jgi:SM-20-related protein
MARPEVTNLAEPPEGPQTAAKPGLTLAPPHSVTDDWLDASQVDKLLDWTLSQRGRFEPATLADGSVHPEARQALSLRDLGPCHDDFLALARVAASPWTQQLRVTPFQLHWVELELAAHNDGAHFVRHVDTFTGDRRGRLGDRLISAIYYFHRQPQGFTGGNLRLHGFAAPQAASAASAASVAPTVDIAPRHNRLVVFPSWLPHEVLSVHCAGGNFADSRFAVNLWLTRNQPAAGHAFTRPEANPRQGHDPV